MKPVFKVWVGTRVAVSVEALAMARSPLASLDKNGDGYVARSEANDAQWQECQEQAASFARAQSPAEILARPLANIGIAGVSAKAVRTISTVGSSTVVRRVGLLSAAAAAVESGAAMVADKDYSLSRFANAALTVGYEFGSGSAAMAAGTAVGVPVGAAASVATTPVGGAVAGFVTGAATQFGVKAALDGVKNAVVFKLSAWLN